MQMLIFISKKWCCKHSCLSLFILVAVLLPVFSSFAMPVSGDNNRPAVWADSIRGKVLDEKGAPMPGVVVQVKGTKKGTQTDEQGRFTITVDSCKG